jgi:hypothetical protein
MMPNKKDGKNDALLFECECGGYHYVEMWYEKINEKILLGGGLWLNFIDHEVPLWHVLKNWWNHRHHYQSEILLSHSDIKEMHKKLGAYLDECDKNRETNKAKNEKID